MTTPAFPKRRILVVDDELFVCEAVKMMLAFDGHTVETASSGKEALDLFDQAKFDLVFTDYAMPDMKGDDLAAAIKARNPSQPVVLITAYAEHLRFTGNPLAGIDFVISKPFLLENLRAVIARLTPANRRPEDADPQRG